MSKSAGDTYPSWHTLLLCCTSTVFTWHRENAGFYSFANVNSSNVEWSAGWMWGVLLFVGLFFGFS